MPSLLFQLTFEIQKIPHYKQKPYFFCTLFIAKLIPVVIFLSNRKSHFD